MKASVLNPPQLDEAPGTGLSQAPNRANRVQLCCRCCVPASRQRRHICTCRTCCTRCTRLHLRADPPLLSRPAPWLGRSVWALQHRQASRPHQGGNRSRLLLFFSCHLFPSIHSFVGLSFATHLLLKSTLLFFSLSCAIIVTSISARVLFHFLCVVCSLAPTICDCDFKPAQSSRVLITLASCISHPAGHPARSPL
ncbi:hypothetical protein B0T17DRAFT_115562 [Bombardia bombarda]|uniref:Uncharacterized protein n=1 Tax=Bombardia bombarda TaxID=252184 RepID=A0AA39U3Z4_9PEZI|nr:hypothetical protein B0T17DRAFT_115562 [Bombardia bombarda]